MRRLNEKRRTTQRRLSEPSVPKCSTVEDEVRETTHGEFRRAKHRGHELSCLLAVLAESVPDAIETADDAEALAGRLHAIVQSGAATLNDLSEIAGRMKVIATVLAHFD
ncbi:MAG TPA: hypothetical protein VIV60_36565 [Polyangiaceae bacterium]